jgi:hypothetical protein
MCFRYSAYGTPLKQVGKNPDLKKKPSQWFFLGFLVFFSHIFAQKREFLGVFSVSRILLGASRL